MNEKTTRNIILDLGGVLLNIDYDAPVRYFEKLGIRGFDEIYSKRTQLPLFDAFEKGLVSPEEFRDEIRHVGKFTAEDKAIDEAWNSMLLDLPLNRMELLSLLKDKYDVYLLSNTNEIHIESFEGNLDKKYGKNVFQDHFKKYYYSCRMRMRKPDPEIFQFVLQEQEMNAAETLFIDDSPQHIEGALKAGINAVHLKNGEELSELLSKLKIIL